MKLIFIYNASSGLLNQIIQSGHKLLSPSTYSCSLCQLTHHSLGERKIWKQFRKEQKIEFQFLHKDEIDSKLVTDKPEYPIVYSMSNNKYIPFLEAREISELTSQEELIRVITHRLNTIRNTSDNY